MLNLTGGNIQSAGGLAVPNGYLTMMLQVDCTLKASPGQVVAAIPVRFYFDSTANLITPATIYSNIELNPSTGYLVNFYDQEGNRVNNDPVIWVFNQAAGSTVDIGTMISTAQGGPAYPNPFIQLLTNGSLNVVQNSLNLVPGTGMNITHDGAGNVTFVVSGLTFQSLAGSISPLQIPARSGSIDYVVDGGALLLTTGAKGQISVPVNCTITGWTLTADQSGSAVVDVLRSTYTSFPTTASIAGTDKPTLASVQKNRNTGPLSSWGSTSLIAGDELQFNLNSVTSCTRLNLSLKLSIPWS